MSLDARWLWCEAWCGSEAKDKAFIVDLCGDPFIHKGETKLDKYQRLEPDLF